MLHRLVFGMTLAGIVLCSCSRSSSSNTAPPRLQPLSSSGVADIDMNGVWEVVEWEPVNEPSGASMPLEFPFAQPEIGSTIEIADDAFFLAGTYPLGVPQLGPNQEMYTYLNQVDTRYALFDLGIRPIPNPQVADGGSARLQIVLGSLHDNEIMGLIDYDSSGLAGRAAGRMRVRMERR